MTPENTIRIGGKPARSYFQALQRAATQHDHITVESRGKHTNKAYDLATEFCKRHDRWNITSKNLVSVEYEGRSVTELTLRLKRRNEEKQDEEHD